MKILLSICWAMALVSLCRADIGWTPQQCDNQYGTPYSTNTSIQMTGNWSQSRVYKLDSETRMSVFFGVGDKDSEAAQILFVTTYGSPDDLLRRFGLTLHQMRPSKRGDRFHPVTRNIEPFDQPFLVSWFKYVNMYDRLTCELIISIPSE